MRIRDLALLAAAALLSHGPAVARDWPMFGQNLSNMAAASGESVLSPSTAGKLRPKWVATTGGDVSARAAIVDGKVYFPDWGGNVWALDAATGKAVWRHQLSDYGFPAGTVSRDTPAVVGGTAYFGTQTGAALVAVDAASGALKWKTSLDDHPTAVITGSPAVTGGIVLIGVSSTEESAAAGAGYQCCSFHGSLVAVSAKTGKILWRAQMAPDGYSGAAVWGSNPVVDARRGLVFIGTGDNYSKPVAPDYLACIRAGGKQATCMAPENHVDSVVALDLGTGAVKWARRLRDSDDWNVACFFGKPGTGNCPKGAGPDYDFGAGPNEFTIRPAGAPSPRTVIGAGQKSGIYSVFDADTGELVWSRLVGPGSYLGGIEWGTATDGKRIYVALSNFDRKPYRSGSAGSFSALDPATGAVLWQTPDPNDAVDLAPTAVANGVVFAGSMGSQTQPTMLALDAATGTVLWKFTAGGAVVAGAAIADGVVYWGSGYGHFGAAYAGRNKFFAFSIGGK